MLTLIPLDIFTLETKAASEEVTKTYSLSTYVRADDMLSFSLTDPDDNTSKTVFTADGDTNTHLIRKFGSGIQVMNTQSYDDSPNVRFFVLPNVNGKVTKIEFTKACRIANQVIVGDHDACPPTWEDTSFFMSIDGMKYNGTDEALTGESHLDERGNTTESENFTFISTDPEGIEGNLSLWLGKSSMFTMLSGCEIKIHYIPAVEPAHEHDFTYSMNGNTLTATCGHSDGRSCSLADSNHQISVSLEAEDAHYQFGYVYPATLLNNSLFASETGATIGNITYRNNTTGVDLGTQKPTGSGENPTGAGNYTASVTINVGGTTYTLTKDYTLSNLFTINNSYPQFSFGTEKYSVVDRAAENEIVTITFTPQNGETLKSLSVKGETTNYSIGNGITKVDDTHYTFLMPAEEVNISEATFGIDENDFVQDGDTYTIKNADGWNYFCLLTNYDTTLDGFNGKTVKLDKDIEVSTMAGMSAHPFKGTFDGQNHTLTFNHEASEDLSAPFHYINGATISNLHVEGAITGDTYESLGGLVGRAEGNITIENCHVSTQISTTVSGSALHGGVIARWNGTNATCTVTGCVYDGLIYNPYNAGVTRSCSGFIGWDYGNNGTITFTDCLSAPAAYGTGKYALGVNCFTFVYPNSEPTLTYNMTNCYYTSILGNRQGRPAATATTAPANLGAATTDHGMVKGYKNGFLYAGNYYTPKYGDVVVEYIFTDYGEHADVTINGEGNNLVGVNITEDVGNVTSVNYNRTFSPVSTDVAVVMLPFDYTCNGSEGGKFYSFAGVDDGPIMSTQVGSLWANTPYLFKPEGTTMTFPNIASMTGGSVTLKTTAEYHTAVYGDWTLYGTYASKTWTGNEVDYSKTYFLDEGILANISPTITVKPTDGYFITSDSYHTHRFTYSATGATITATCSAADCTLTDNKTTLTINAPIKTIYGDANSASATLTGLDDFNSATSLNITETGIKYVGRGNTTYAESDTAPTDAGTYTASITAGSKTASVDYTIAPKSISITGATATDRDYVKDSTSVEISAVTFDGATLTNGTDYTVTGAMDDDTAGDSKSVTVSVTLMNGNYTFGTNGNTTTTTVKIDKINHDGVSASGSAKYGAEGSVDLSSLIEAGGSLGEVSVSDTNNVLDGTPTIETDGKALKFKFSNNSNNVGKTATVTIPVEGATNYKDYNIVVTLMVTDKIVPTLTVSDYTKTYDGNSVTISDLTKSAKDGSSDIEGTWDFEGTSGLKDVSDSGTITVRFTPTDTTNYESATATFMLTINRKAVTVKADNKQMVVGTTPEPELTATVSGTVGNDTVDYTVSREAGTVVGTYTITPSGDAEQGNYAVSYETGTFTITEDTTAPVVKKAPKAITGLVYNGTAQVLVEPGEAENGTMYYAVTTENTAPADNLYTASNYAATGAGTYYVWYKVVGDDNLNNSEAEKVTVTISQLSIKNATVSLDETDLVYTGSEQSVQVSSVKIGETVLKANSDYEVSGTTGTNKGDYTVTVTGKGNYKDVVTSKWNIAMATPVIDVLPSASAITYGQSLADSTLTEGTAKLGENVVEGTFSWKDDATKPAVSDSEKTEYVVVFTPNDAENYNTVECKVKVTVNKAIAGVAKAPTANTLLYNGKAQALVKAGEATDGIMNFAIGKDDKTAPAEGWNISIPTATNAGTYHVWYRVVGDDNHSDSAIKTFDVTIEVPDTNKLEVSLEGWTYGEKAKQPTVKADFGADKVSYSYSDKEDGTFKTDVPSSVGTWYVKATIPKTDNYPESEAIKSFEIAIADSISGAPEASKSVDYTIDTVGKVELPANWTWKMADINKELTVGAAVEATAEYTGTDKDNYVDAVKTVKVSITRNACTHDNLEEVSEVPASCTKEGVLAHSKCPVCNKLFVKDDDKLVEKTADELKIEAVGHSYGKATYSWSDDHATCTATKVCVREGCDENSEGHVVTETVKTTSKTTPAGCEEKGVITYTATFTDKDFGTVTDSVDIAAKNHDYVITYEWSEDGKTCTATAVCKNDSTHKVTETAEYKADKETSKIKATVKETATTEKMGTTTYTASFENALFAAQTKDVVDIPKVENPAENPSENPSQGGQDNPQQGNDSSQDNKKSEQTAADKPQEIVTDKPSEKTADTPATPVENKTTTVVKEEGTTIPVADNKAEVVVTSKPGEEPSVAYKGTTDESAKAIEIPETVVSNGVTYAVTEISEGAFENNKTVESVKLGDNITTLGENAFAGCTNLKSVELPKNIKELPKGAFKDCTLLKKVDIPKNVKIIGDKTFSGCSKLATMNLKNNVTEIGEKAFEGCTSLKKVTLGKNVTKIGGKAFNGAKKLKTITIQSKKLTKKSVKGAFKGSKINIIKIDTGSKAQNMKLVKKYKKIFTKKNTGRKVIIK